MYRNVDACYFYFWFYFWYKQGAVKYGINQDKVQCRRRSVVHRKKYYYPRENKKKYLLKALLRGIQ